MVQFFRILGFLLVTGGSFQALGLLSQALDCSLSLLGLALFYATFASELSGTRRPERGAAIAGALCLAAALPAAGLAPLGMAAFHLLAMAGTLLLLAGAPRTARLELQAYALALCIVVLFAELNRLFPLVWHLEQASAALLSATSARLAREPRNLGPTAMGLPLLLAFVATVLGRAAVGAGRGRPRARLAVPALLLIHLGYLVLLTPYASWMGRHHPTQESLVLNSQWLFLLIGAVFLALWNETATWRGIASPSAESPAAPLAWRRRFEDPRLASGFSLGVMLVLLVGRTAAPAQGPVKVMLYDAGFTNWIVPRHGAYGEGSAGMFGVLPGLLQATGHHVERSADLQRLDGPEAPDCLVMINIQEYLEPADKERVWRFVRRGGGLLCLGDHTSVAGIRGPFNDLLSPTGIRLAFDSATFFASGWSDGLEIRSHPMNRGVVNEEDYQIWVGASLEIDANATPVVVARYGWSDLGDMADVQRAYLGDRRYNPNELLGDLVLGAEARLGKGKVLVLGDTSGYQNLSLPRSWTLVLRSIAHLGHPGGASPGPRQQIAVLLIFALLLGLVTGGGAVLAPVAATTAGLVVTTAAISGLLRAPAEPLLDWSRAVRAPVAAADSAAPSMHGTAIVDRSHGGRYDLRAWNETSVGGLTLCLMRDGFFPMLSERFPQRELEKADVVVLVAPQRSYSTGERRTLRRFLERGGRLLVCVGNEELDGARSLLRDYGLGVRGVPLAHFRTGPGKEDLVFLEGWSLEVPDAARVLVRQWGQPVVASLRVGRGVIFLVGDTHFLLDRNLEGRETWFPGNIAFLTAIDQGREIQPIEGKFGDPKEQGALVDTPRDSTRHLDWKRP
jgi:hypothetical protein